LFGKILLSGATAYYGSTRKNRAARAVPVALPLLGDRTGGAHAGVAQRAARGRSQYRFVPVASVSVGRRSRCHRPVPSLRTPPARARAPLLHRQLLRPVRRRRRSPIRISRVFSWRTAPGL